MHRIPVESLKANTNYMKSCILYELLSEKPILDCYRHFCERNGEDAMSYRDFEYHYYRFYGGDVDFEHERRTDSKEKMLTELPVEILGMITGYLKPEERVDLRLTCKKFKTIVDMEPVTFKNIAVEWTPNVFGLYINKKYFEYKIDNGRFIRDGYRDEGLETALDHFAHVMKHPKLRVDRLEMVLPDDLFPEEREQLLKSLPHALHVNSARLQGSVKETLAIVSHMKPEVLKRLLVTGCPKELTPVFESKHWKQTEVTCITSTQLSSKSFPLFYNFRNFHINVRSMDSNDLHLLIANVAKNPSFQCGLIKAALTYYDIEEPSPLEDRMENGGSPKLRYQIPDSRHYLEIYKGHDRVYTIQRY